MVVWTTELVVSVVLLLPAAVVVVELAAAVVLAEEALDAVAPGTTAELVAVATELVCATELGKPLYSVGPGMV